MDGRKWRVDKTLRRMMLAGGVLLLLALGVVFARWASERQDQWMRDDLMHQTQLIAQTLHPDQLQRLRGNPTDADRPDYRRLKEQLMAARQVNPAWRWIYLMGRRPDGTVFFQVDSEANEAPDASPPGQTYEEVSADLQQVFDTGQAANEGPLPDRWGIWVSAFVPLKNITGELVSVVGIDIDASQWSQIRNRAMRVPLLSCLALILIWLGGAGLLARRASPGYCRTRFRRHIESFLVLATGLVLTLTAVWLAHQTEIRNRKIAFRHLAAIEIAPTFDTAMELQKLVLEGFGTFFENSEDVTAKEFRHYAAHLSRILEVHTWCWAEAVEAAERPQFEKNAKSRTGKPDFQIWEKGAQDQPIAAGARDRTFPIVYLAPKKNSQFALGFDLGSDPLRHAAIVTAEETRLPSASDPVSLLQLSGDSAKGILVLRPVFRTNDPGRLKGLVAADLKVNNWLRASQGGNSHLLPMAVLDLFQLRAGQAPLLLSTTAAEEEEHLEHFHDRPAGTIISPLLVFGKTYAIAAHATPSFTALYPLTAVWLLGLAGLVLTAAVTWVFGFLANRRDDLVRLVHEQSHELATHMRRYDLLAKQNRIITWELDLDGVYVALSSVVQDVLGYLPEELVGKVHFYDLHPEAGREEFAAKIRTLTNQGKSVLNSINPMVAKSGEIVWVSSSGIPIRDAQGKPLGYWGIDTDITDRKHAEEDLIRLAQENQGTAARYAALIRASNTGAWEYHDDTAYMWASPEYFAMLGRTPADFDLADGEPNIEPIWLDLLHPDDRNHARREFIDYMKRPEGMFQHTFRMRHADGHWVWILSRMQVLRDANGQPTSVVVGTHIDITEAKRAEQALFDSEQKFRTLFVEMLEGFSVHEIICDDQGRPADYRFLDVNPAFERLTGLKAQDILGKTALEVLPQLEQRWIDDFGRVALTGEPAFLQQFSGPLGKHYEVTVFRPAPRQFACIFTDITESRRAEDELRESRRQYIALMANLPGMAYRCRNDREWTMEFVSQGCLELTGYTSEDLLANRRLSFNELILPSYRERVWEKWQEILQAHGQFEDEYEITTRTGETKWVWEQGEGVYDEQGRVLALEGFIADITDRKLAGAERERLTRAIEQSGENILMTDANGIILYVNPAFTRTTGYAREEIVGQNSRILQSGQHDVAFYRDLWSTLTAGKTWEGQLINKRKDGTLFTEQSSISPVRDSSGQIVHYVAVQHDITQELRAHQEKENLQAQLQQAQKMESIGRLAGGVAHDFNNMLQAILGYAELAIEQVDPALPPYPELKEIQKAAQRSAALTRQLQTFARKQATTPRVLDLNEAIENMSGMLRRLIGEEIHLVWQLGQGPYPVKIDPSQLDQVLANLFINARDAIDKSGHIFITTRQLEIGHVWHTSHSELPPGSYVGLSVRDDGNGMSPEVISHLFEPFFTTKMHGRGTGLGLSTVYGIVTQNQGGIQVRSGPGQGSTFEIFFPRQAKAAVQDQPADDSSAPVSGGNETILLVDDEETILQTTRRLLESLGYVVLATRSPVEALHLAQNPQIRIDLLVTDVIMPDISGPELVRRLSKDYPKLRCLYMSGYTANLLSEQGVKGTHRNFISKPFSRNLFARKVREALDGP